MTDQQTMYTVVQHSAMGYNRDIQFLQGLEPRPVTFKADREKVERNGGLFLSYIEAEDFCDWAMYQSPQVDGLIPKAGRHGIFAKAKVDGLRIFVPTSAGLKAWKAHKGTVAV